MEDFTIAIYCFLDDYLHIIGKKASPQRKCSDAEIITTAIIAAQYFGGNYTTARLYLSEAHGVNYPDKSNFSRLLNRLSETISSIFIGFGQCIKEWNIESEYLIDSFPVAVCKNIRIPRCKLLRNEAYRGKNTSKREYFYGFKVQVITTKDGVPVEYFLSAGSYADITAFQSMNIGLPSGSKLYADSGYTDYDLEDCYREIDLIDLQVVRKSNSKRKDHPAAALWKNAMRKRIEITFSEITNLFPKKIHAITPQGFILKIVLFIFAFTLKKIF